MVFDVFGNLQIKYEDQRRPEKMPEDGGGGGVFTLPCFSVLLSLTRYYSNKRLLWWET